MEFKPGKLYRFTALWNPFKIKPTNIKDWSEFTTWPQCEKTYKPSKRCLLYLGIEPWYGSGLLHKFLYDNKIIYCKYHYNLENTFEEIKIE